MFSILSYRHNEESWNKMNEFFNGFKTDRTHRSFVVALQSRRLLFVVILICLYSVSLHIIIGVLTTFQLIFLIYVVALRPYQEIKSNIVKILNELIFLFLLSSLNFLNKESDWSLSMIYIYMNIICFNTVIVCLILIGSVYFSNFIGFLIKDIYIWCKNRKQHLRTVSYFELIL